MSISSSSVATEPQCECCDGQSECVSTTSTYDPEYDETPHIIPVLTSPQWYEYSEPQVPPPWYDEYHPRVTNQKQSKKNRITIRRDNRLVVGESLPIISVSNLRSLIPKISNFKNDLLDRDISVALLSEVWEKASCKKHQFEIEKMLQMDGLKYISTRRTTKRGGGAAIVVNLRKFSVEKIPVIIPNNLEVVWGLMRPKTSSTIREIIVAAFYSPPKSKKNSQLLDHLMSTTHFLLSKYPNAGLVYGGDKNNLNISSLLTGIPRLRQIVTRNTYKLKVLDIILTNMSQLYSVPVIVPPVYPDNPLHGVPSAKLDAIFPLKTVELNQNIDQPFFSGVMKKLEYC